MNNNSISIINEPNMTYTSLKTSPPLNHTILYPISNNAALFPGNPKFRSFETDYSEINLMIVLNIVTLTSTFFTCTSTSMQPLVVASCIFNILSLLTALLLNNLIGIDTLLPPESTPSQLYKEIGESKRQKFLYYDNYLFRKTLENISNIGELFKYTINESGLKCASVEVSELGFGNMPGLRHTVCITPKGILKMTEPHKFPYRAAKKLLLKRLNRENRTGKSVAKPLSKLLIHFGNEGDNIITSLNCLYEKYRDELWEDQKLKVEVISERELLFNISLELL